MAYMVMADEQLLKGALWLCGHFLIIVAMAGHLRGVLAMHQRHRFEVDTCMHAHATHRAFHRQIIERCAAVAGAAVAGAAVALAAVAGAAVAGL